MPRTLKKTAIIDGKTLTAYDLIRRLLLLEGEKRFGEIKQHLQNHQAGYSNNIGLSLALKSMERKGIIRKEEGDGRYPVYYLSDKEVQDTELLGLEFQLSVNQFIDDAPRLQKQKQQSEEEYFIKRLIRLYGFYALYTELKSWEFASDKNKHEINDQNRRMWLENTLPMTKHSIIFEQAFSELMHSSYDSISIYKDCEKLHKFKDLEKLLEKLYPDETRFFAKIFDSLQEKAEEHRKLVKKIRKNERLEKRSSSKLKIN